LRNPEYEHHIAITLDYGAHCRTGLPKPRELKRLQEFESRIIAHLDGHGMVAGSETADARRTVHVYVRGIQYTVTHDPEWRPVAHLAQVSARRAA
jgi:hypothetical protein